MLPTGKVYMRLQVEKGKCIYLPVFLLFMLKYTCRQKSLCSRNDFYWPLFPRVYVENRISISLIYSQRIIFNRKTHEIIIMTSVITTETTEGEN